MIVSRTVEALQFLGRGLLFMAVAANASAGETGADERSSPSDWFDSLYLQAGVGTHWADSDDHEGTPVLAGLEAAHDDRHLVGISLFNNSFGQFSQYYYYGYKWRVPFISDAAHFKLTGGLLYGYVDEFEDKLALNQNGWAPAIVPAIGFKQGRLGADFVVLGDAGFMILVGYDIWRR